MTEKRPKRRWYQYRLRTLFVAVLVLSLPLSWFAVRMEIARKQREVVEAIEELGGSVDDWIGWRELLGDNPPVVQVNLQNTDANDAALERVKELGDLEFLDLRSTHVTDAGLAHLQTLTNLTHLDLTGTQVTAEGVNKLRQSLPGCEIVW